MQRKLQTKLEANQAYQALQRDLANMGFCGSIDGDGNPKHVNDFIPASGEVTADQFAEWVMLAEGREPFDGSGYQAELKKLFILYMGSGTVDVSRLR